MFMLAQIVGGAIGYGLARAIYQHPTLIAIAQENPNELDADGERSSRR
jgi:ABC-type protease/lipase transport system fused ATPase/permease subunit